MSIEQQIASLTTATTDLLNAVNVKKAALDSSVLDAQNYALSASADKDQTAADRVQTSADRIAAALSAQQAADNAPVQSVAGKTGAVTLGPADVGAAAASHGHAIADVSGLTDELSNAVKLSGNQSIAGIKSFSRIDQGAYSRQTITLPAPGVNALGGRWFVRLCPTTSPVFISGRFRIGGIWNYAAIMGLLELECGVYFEPGATSITYGSCRVSAATGPAYENLRISDLTVVSGWVGLYVYSINTNSVEVLIDGSFYGDFSPSSSPWESSDLPAQRPVEFAGGVSLLSGQLNGNAATATKLATARSISLAGDVTGSASFDGSGDVTIAATVADSSHSHAIANVSGLQTALDLKVSKDSIVGTVSQSGGIPTGAVVERGSNANGEYVRFADGTQICTRTFLASNLSNTSITSLNSQSGDYRTAQSSVSYAAVFSGQPSYAGVSWENQESGWWASAFPSGPGGAQVNLRAKNSVAAPTYLNANIYLVAIGRWY